MRTWVHNGAERIALDLPFPRPGILAGRRASAPFVPLERARLVLVARRFRRKRFPDLTVLSAAAAAWVRRESGDRARVGVVRLGFSFIPA